jgi:hypothetical protein
VGEGAATISGKGKDKPSAAHSKCWLGEFKNHQGMVKDILADVGRSSKPYLLQRFLNSNINNLFKYRLGQTLLNVNNCHCIDCRRASAPPMLRKALAEGTSSRLNRFKDSSNKALSSGISVF